MKTIQKRGVFWAVLVAAFFLFINGCATLETVSVMPDRQIAIDANDNEWQNWFYDKGEKGTKAAISNDSDYVYICFTTQDEEILMDMIQKGFIIWFNSKGNKSKQLGINYPFVNQGGPGGPGGPGGAPPEGGSPPEGGAPPQGGARPGGGGADSVSVSELKIMTSKKDEGTVLSLLEAEAMGISTSIFSDNSGKLVYELKMPLKKGDNRPYVVEASPENIIGVGLMVYKSQSSRVGGISGMGGSMSDMSGGGMGGGGMGGGGGAPPGGGGGGGFDASAGSGFNTGDMSGMSGIYDFFGTDDDVFTMANEDVSAVNAQGGGPGGGGGGGMGGGGMGGGDMGGGGMGGDMGGGGMGAYESTFEIWAKVTLTGI